MALAYLVSLPQNQFQPADLLQPRYAADADLGFWMVYEYDPEVDVYHLLVVMQHDSWQRRDTQNSAGRLSPRSCMEW